MTKLKLFFDTLPLETGHAVRGVGNYTRNLLEQFKIRDDIELVSKDQKPDLIHYPFFDLFSPTLLVNNQCPVVATIHDVIPLLFPKHYPPGIKGLINFLRQKKTLKKVKRVITDSENSKGDIVKHLDYPADNIDVIYLSAGNNFKGNNMGVTMNNADSKIKEQYHLPDKFVLYVGDVNWNKNILGLIKACKIACMPVVIVGKQAAEKNFDWNHIENQPHSQLLEQYGEDSDIMRIGWISEDDLIKAYKTATVYCQPSFYEGFGLQILEAMACGCPVITSNGSSCPEIAGKAAILIDPNSVEEIARAIVKVAENTQLRQELIKAGFDQARKFSWEKTATETIRCYHGITKR